MLLKTLKDEVDLNNVKQLDISRIQCSLKENSVK